MLFGVSVFFGYIFCLDANYHYVCMHLFFYYCPFMFHIVFTLQYAMSNDKGKANYAEKN